MNHTGVANSMPQSKGSIEGQDVIDAIKRLLTRQNDSSIYSVVAVSANRGWFRYLSGEAARQVEVTAAQALYEMRNAGLVLDSGTLTTTNIPPQAARIEENKTGNHWTLVERLQKSGEGPDVWIRV